MIDIRTIFVITQVNIVKNGINGRQEVLSKREKEIIRVLYCQFNDEVYSSTGPSWLSKEDYKDMKIFLERLKGEDMTNE
jgi:hypothetical protein